MHPNIAFELATLEHVARLNDTRARLQQERAARRRPRWHAWWRPPSRRQNHALAA